LEYVEYGELFHLLQAHGPLQERHARFYAAQIAVAVCHLHEHKMVHRDIKPENILIDARGYCKLTDFGFCKVVEDRTYSVCG
jgi:protein kinase A